jgi:hypothetical protein
LDECYAQILETSYLNPQGKSIFEKSGLLSSKVLELFLGMLAELENSFNLNNLVIPDIEAFEKMISCSTFADYVEACLKPI